MNGPMPVAWIFMLLMVLIVGGAIAAIIWRSWIVGGIVLLFFVMVFGLYFVRLDATPSQPPSIVVLHEEGATPATNSEIDPTMLRNADVYPSMQEGAKNLALRLCDSIQQTKPPISTDNIRIIAAKKDQITEIIRQVFADRFAQANVVADDSHGGNPSDLTVTFSITETSKTDKCLKFVSRQAGRDIPSVDTCVKEVAWVSNFDDFRSKHTKGEWIVGWSSLLATKDAALKHAREQAARQMKHYVVAKFPQINRPNFDQLIYDRLENDLFRHKYASEEFVQQLHLSATGDPVYRAAVLADVSSQQLQRVQTTILPDIRRQSDSVRHFSLGTMGLGVVICVVYLFLNWATRGYFQMNLRLGAFLVLIAGVLLLLTIS